MAWLAIDHNIHRHPKFRGMPDAEFVIWHMGLCYAAEFWTDGFIPHSEFPKKSQQKFTIDLVNRNLWHTISRNGVEGFQIHDYSLYQTLKNDYEETKQKDRARKRKKGDIPDGTNDGISKDSEQSSKGIPVLKEEKTNEKKTTSRWPQSDTPTPTPPRPSQDELDTQKNPPPDEANAIFRDLGWRE